MIFGFQFFRYAQTILAGIDSPHEFVNSDCSNRKNETNRMTGNQSHNAGNRAGQMIFWKSGTEPPGFRLRAYDILLPTWSLRTFSSKDDVCVICVFGFFEILLLGCVPISSCAFIEGMQDRKIRSPSSKI